MIRLGIDLGGTKIEIIALDGNGQTLLRRRVDTPQGNYPAILAAIDALIRDVENELACTCTVGIGMPGALSSITGRVKNSNSVCLNDKPIKQDIEQLLRREVRIANDANCFALSEATDGAAQNAGTVFGVIVGTGTGGGIVFNGRNINGVNSIAGEWGHNPLPWPQADELPGRQCYCGKQGCIETWLSGPGFSADHHLHGGSGDNAQDIVALAAQGDAIARNSLQRYEQRMARALASVINVLDPDIIVLGGGMSNITQLYDHVPALWQDYVFSDHVATKLVAAVHGDSGGVRGAAWLWQDDE